MQHNRAPKSALPPDVSGFLPRLANGHERLPVPQAGHLGLGSTGGKGAVISLEDAGIEFFPLDEPLLAARANAEDLGGADPVAPATGSALRFIATAIGARAVVEIGTGCGSSGIWLLRGMRPGAVLTSVDTEPECQRLARKVFQQAGFAANQARLILGRAQDVLPRLADGGYDMVFCDTDPADYFEYLPSALRLLRPGGIVLFDDALLPAQPEIAEVVRTDDRLVPLLLPVGEGLLAAVRK
jgi:predicted O-methyltransferase YrrM